MDMTSHSNRGECHSIRYSQTNIALSVYVCILCSIASVILLLFHPQSLNVRLVLFGRTLVYLDWQSLTFTRYTLALHHFLASVISLYIGILCLEAFDQTSLNTHSQACFMLGDSPAWCSLVLFFWEGLVQLYTRNSVIYVLVVVPTFYWPWTPQRSKEGGGLLHYENEHSYEKSNINSAS